MTDPIVWPTAPPTAVPPPPPAAVPPPPASERTRGGELLLEFVLMACTFGFGWVGWWIISWADGQSPAKVVLHLHVVTADDGRVAGFGRMAVREVLGKGIAGAVGLLGIYTASAALIAVAGMYLFFNGALALADPLGRTLWDRIAKTIVLEGDPPPLPNVPGPASP